jgi:1-phosphatidylinositol-3-phosphate 5-kinase
VGWYHSLWLRQYARHIRFSVPSTHSIYAGIPDHTDITVVGGSFAVRGVLSPAMFDALVSVLSIGTFTVLSLGLELVLLRDSGIKLRYPPVPPVPPQPTPVPIHPIAARIKRRSRPSRPGSGLWNFLTKTTENIIQRSRTISLDTASRPPRGVDANQQSDGDITPTASSLRKGAPSTFSSLVEDVNRTKNLFSTSPGVEFPIPQLLRDIAEKEKRGYTTSLTTGDETGLTSILGWTGRKEEFLGPESFLRHQSITTIYSEHSYTRQKPTSDENAEETLIFTICSSARWMTYQYYAKDTTDDQTLGEMVKRICGNADQPCVRPECKAKLRDHELRWVHHRTKIIGRVMLGDDTEGACMWASCAVCEAATDRKEMAEGTE